MQEHQERQKVAEEEREAAVLAAQQAAPNSAAAAAAAAAAGEPVGAPTTASPIRSSNKVCAVKDDARQACLAGTKASCVDS